MKVLETLLDAIEKALFPAELAPKRVPVRNNKPNYLR
jgi:hypothetical protein